MTDVTIPPEVVEAAATAIFDASPFREHDGPLSDQSERYQALTRRYARAAIAAALSAWPGSCNVACTLADLLLLPLPQEPRDER